MEVFGQLPEVLLPWYRQNKRDLPWRRDKDPYHIWISEIMLQQTRVEAVKRYYCRFIEALPTVRSLANVDDDLLYKLWEGLGYYSRARNLKIAAIIICDRYCGVFPARYDEILSLPGIGEYTAGAICSIAYDQPIPAVDGNVLRVAARLMDDDTPVDTPSFKRKIRAVLLKNYPSDAGDFTQALMELGADICGPNRKAACDACPCKSFCLSYQHGTVDVLPVRLPKRNKRIEKLTVFVLSCNGHYAIEKRPSKGLLAGLWQFPNVIGEFPEQEALELLEEQGIKPQELLRVVEREHIFTHIKWEMRGIYVEVKEISGKYTWLTGEQINADVALPTAFRQFWMLREDDQNE